MHFLEEKSVPGWIYFLALNTQYITALGLENEPVFAWWVSYNLKKRDRIIAAINTCVCKSTNKFGIQIPTSIKEAHGP